MRSVGENEHRHPVQPVFTPSSRSVEHFAAGNDRRGGAEQVLMEDLLGVTLGRPAVEDLASLSKPWVLVDVRTSNEAVYRHRDVDFHDSHEDP